MPTPEQLRLAFDDWRLTPLGQLLATRRLTLGAWRDGLREERRIEEIRLACSHPVSALCGQADGTWTCEDCDAGDPHAD